MGTHQFDLFCTSTALLRLAYFDILSNLDFVLVEKYRSKYSLGQSKVGGSKYRKGRTEQPNTIRGLKVRVMSHNLCMYRQKLRSAKNVFRQRWFVERSILPKTALYLPIFSFAELPYAIAARVNFASYNFKIIMKPMNYGP